MISHLEGLIRAQHLAGCADRNSSGRSPWEKRALVACNIKCEIKIGAHSLENIVTVLRDLVFLRRLYSRRVSLCIVVGGSHAFLFSCVPGGTIAMCTHSALSARFPRRRRRDNGPDQKQAPALYASFHPMRRRNTRCTE